MSIAAHTRQVPTFKVIIHTVRYCLPEAYPEGAHFHDGEPKAAITAAIKQWFIGNGLEARFVKQLKFHDSRGKPHAHFYIDDNALLFTGNFGAVTAFIERMTPHLTERFS